MDFRIYYQSKEHFFTEMLFFYNINLYLKQFVIEITQDVKVLLKSYIIL